MVSRDPKKTRAAAEYEVLCSVLGTQDGRRVLYSLIAEGMEAVISLDPVVAQRQLGIRDVSVRLLKNVLDADPNMYILMQQEALKFEAMYPVGEEEEDAGY